MIQRRKVLIFLIAWRFQHGVAMSVVTAMLKNGMKRAKQQYSLDLHVFLKQIFKITSSPYRFQLP